MSEAVHMADLEMKGITRAIVCFGPATPVTGMRAGDYFQVVIDPEMVSPGGDYIRFSAAPPKDNPHAEVSEIHGWQRIAAMTVCEVLDEGPANSLGKSVVMRAITTEAPKE